MNSKWNWERFWITFAVIAAAFIFVYFISVAADMNFFVMVALVLAAFCVISALTLMVMWFIPKFEEWASEEGRKRASKDYMEGKDKHWVL